jgi:putative endonuclease
MRTYHVYILANESRTLYVGMTSDLTQRMEQHRAGRVAGFTARYRVNRLVYYEETGDAYAAVTRERRLKRWRRKWKLGLVDECNPLWRDLTPDALVG